MWRSLLLLYVFTAACGGGGSDKSPYNGIRIDATFKLAGLDGPVDMIRDNHGIPHIYGKTIGDVSFASGYVMASDRLAQMNIFRHVAEGRMAELFGALSQSIIDDDIRFRIHRFNEKAETAFADLQASTDPVDQKLVTLLQRYADGVNQYATELAAGQHTLDPAVSEFFDPTRFEPWTPVDSLALGYFQAYSLSFDVGSELYITDAYQRAKTAFDDAAPGTPRARRTHAGLDLYSPRPMDTTSTIDGFPNVGSDTGSRARPAPLAPTTRPRIPDDVLAAAIRATTPQAALGKAFHNRRNGSNDWAVSPALTGGGAIVANDPHLTLYNPSIFYVQHLTVTDENIDVQGITFPGIPGVILGHNAHLAWGSTTAYHDVSDYYDETITPCTSGGGDCVTWKGTQVPLQTFTETINVGALGTMTDSVNVTYELVPHHGPILLDVVNHKPAPRTGSKAIAIKYTGYEPTRELRAIFLLDQATTVQQGFDALDDFGFGAQNWMLGDDAGSIGWTTESKIPLRTAGCYTFDPATAPDGVAPFFVVPGDGSCEWDGEMDARYIPHSINPTKGYLATANNDLVGTTAHANPLEAPMTPDGHLLYVSAFDDPGYRVGRITRRLEALAAAGAGISMADIEKVQADTHSNNGDKMKPFVMTALAAVAAEIATPGSHPDLVTFVAGLSAAQKASLADASARLDAWTLETPDGVLGQPSQQDQDDAVATTIFAAFMHFYLTDTFGDEMAAMGYGGIDSDFTARAGVAVFERPTELHSGIAVETGDPILCDDLNTPSTVESCTYDVARAMIEALAWGEGQFGTADLSAWKWGKLHTLTLSSLLPSDQLAVPPADDPDPALRAGYPRHGDPFAVDASDPGYGLSFSYGHGPAMRNVMQFTGPGRIITHFALPGGLVFDRSSGHYRDLFDMFWSKNQYFELAYTTQQIIDGAETHWRFAPL